MTKYTYSQIETIWEQNGGNKLYAPIAAAIAMAESGGDSESTDNDSNGTTDRGLWQINSIHGGQSTYDVNGNAKAAIAISNDGTNWSPWVTYNSGAYKKFLSGAAPSAVSGTTSSAVSLPGVSGITGSITTIAGAFTHLDTLLTDIMSPGFWLRIGAFFAGILCVVAGIWCLVRASDNSPLVPQNIPMVVPI